MQQNMNPFKIHIQLSGLLSTNTELCLLGAETEYLNKTIVALIGRLLSWPCVLLYNPDI
jgi:hypothetical protein